MGSGQWSLYLHTVNVSVNSSCGYVAPPGQPPHCWKDNGYVGDTDMAYQCRQGKNVSLQARSAMMTDILSMLQGFNLSHHPWAIR